MALLPMLPPRLSICATNAWKSAFGPLVMLPKTKSILASPPMEPPGEPATMLLLRIEKNAEPGALTSPLTVTVAVAVANPAAGAGHGPGAGAAGDLTYNAPTDRGVCHFCDDNPPLPRTGVRCCPLWIAGCLCRWCW